eukprot:CAMPEP_0114367856 /NCGR_PEP_ID=MMETSP0101-20121206/30384_1 /TAXON_ID=38822 ORGANISM="Pteridomonas danica, Strain PT" /NCGR_SAMPLE_ID=MMETSP0101 /ASSEMBLY_ACC=CAM_ASM_000211 /LENGTH=42 /DNA_ID= /DNA_START= /DNA_END= /DNA_ORIENTATION=
MSTRASGLGKSRVIICKARRDFRDSSSVSMTLLNITPPVPVP